jgi:hypothetical protein
MDFEMNKRGQVAIFVIVAIIIVAAVGIYFFISGKTVPGISGGEEFEPEGFLGRCFREAMRETIEQIMPTGGFREPRDYKVYNNIEVAYLCKNVNYYQPCISQHPLYISELDKEIERELEDDIDGCFDSLKVELENRNYAVSGVDEFTHDIILKPEIVELKVAREFSFSKNDEVRDFDNFDVSLSVPVYDLAQVVAIIAEQEAQFCYFEYVGFMNLYPRWDIRVDSLSDSTKIYSVKDKESGIETNIAIRGCAIPAGL